MRFLEHFRALRSSQRDYKPLVEVDILHNSLLWNLNQFKKLRPGVAVAPVLKSNAYGHGLVQVARIFDPQESPFFAVDSPFEAMILNNAGIKTPVLVLDFTTIHNLTHLRLPKTSYAIGSLEQLIRLNKEIKHPLKIHLKIDTGMHRQGLELPELKQALALIKKQPLLSLEGIFSHFADPVDHQDFTSQVQIARWHEGLTALAENFGSIRYKHISGTTGYNTRVPIDANVARVGNGLYGIAPFLPLELRGAMQIITSITAIKHVPKGESVGYDLTFVAQRETRTAVLPLGYYEGIDRRLSNSGVVKIRDAFYKIVGRVSMNLTSVDITNAPLDLGAGERVIVVSAIQNDPNSIQNIAKACNSIPHEIFVHFPLHLRRTVV